MVWLGVKGRDALHSAAQRQPNRAKRLECAELAPAVERRGSLKAGASSAHSKRFATTLAPIIFASCEEFRRLWCSVPNLESGENVNAVERIPTRFVCNSAAHWSASPPKNLRRNGRFRGIPPWSSRNT